MHKSFLEASARDRVLGLLDPHSFREFLPPQARASSPHLALLDQPVAFDDGIIVGAGSMHGAPVLVASQEGRFLGGAVGEVHGAKLVGLIRRAALTHAATVVILFDSGGVRLHEANAGLVAVSEILRALLAARAAGVRFIGLIGGGSGCFGGTGLVARCCDALVLSEEGRLAMSGPEVIENMHGVEEFDSRDRALVWRVTGGKHRYLLGEADALVDDDIGAFRRATLALLHKSTPLTLAAVEDEHEMLRVRLERFGDCDDAPQIWQALGVHNPAGIAMMTAEEFVAHTGSAARIAK